jgi:hypothetical protein
MIKEINIKLDFTDILEILGYLDTFSNEKNSGLKKKIELIFTNMKPTSTVNLNLK